jgi:predicted RNase H-like HicB family nuclease
MRTYYAAVHKDPDSDYGACFPGVPGCITSGSTMDELAAMGREALQGHLEVTREYGEEIPEPLSLEEVKRHEDAKGAIGFLEVQVEAE